MGQCAGFSRRCAALPVSSLCLSRCMAWAEAVQACIVEYSKCCFGWVSKAGDASQKATACHRCASLRSNTQHLEPGEGNSMVMQSARKPVH